MASLNAHPLLPDFEVLYFKQKQGENLKDAWYRLMESYRVCNLKGDAKILLTNFYVGLALHHRQLLDFAAKGNFIELDVNAAYEILEGILGVPPQKKGFSFTPDGVQIWKNSVICISIWLNYKNIMNLSNISMVVSII